MALGAGDGAGSGVDGEVVDGESARDGLAERDRLDERPVLSLGERRPCFPGAVGRIGPDLQSRFLPFEQGYPGRAVGGVYSPARYRRVDSTASIRPRAISSSRSRPAKTS